MVGTTRATINIATTADIMSSILLLVGGGTCILRMEAHCLGFTRPGANNNKHNNGNNHANNNTHHNNNNNYNYHNNHNTTQHQHQR